MQTKQKTLKPNKAKSVERATVLKSTCVDIGEHSRPKDIVKV